jgi:deoxyribodipyrimidine photo-lyase
MAEAPTVDPARLRTLSDAPLRSSGRYVLYWMQQAQRSRANPALEVAVERANALDLPVLVAFGLDDGYPGANLRSMAYLLDGLADVAHALRARGIAFAVRRGSPPEVAEAFAQEAAAVVVDRGYLRHQRAWRRQLAEASPATVLQVEGEVIVPTALASDKREHAARTIRPKLWRHAERFVVPVDEVPLRRQAPDLDPGDALPRVEVRDVPATLASLRLDRGVPVVDGVRGGQGEARRRFDVFLRERFRRYAPHRNQPQTDDVSHLSKALHFGHLSPVEAALAAREAAPDAENLDAFLEELLVRRELAVNFVLHADDYDRYETLPDWARRTLDEHRGDPREHLYDDAAFENAETHDPYWNAAMREMRATGYMHNYMRMYWGKKILEWSASPEEAFERTMRLNDRWFLDGRDPNSYAGVAWCYGLHDRGWTERPVYGKVRYMNANGLRRKADPDAYVAKVERLERAEAEADRAWFDATAAEDDAG